MGENSIEGSVSGTKDKNSDALFYLTKFQESFLYEKIYSN